jgi:hypothetical protein
MRGVPGAIANNPYVQIQRRQPGESMVNFGQPGAGRAPGSDVIDMTEFNSPNGPRYEMAPSAGGGEGWQDYMPEGEPTGMRYRLGEAGNDEAARQNLFSRIDREAAARRGGGGGGGGYSAPTGSYYDAHPEERAFQDTYDTLRPAQRNDAQDYQDFRNRGLLESSFASPADKVTAGRALAQAGKARGDQEYVAGTVAGQMGKVRGEYPWRMGNAGARAMTAEAKGREVALKERLAGDKSRRPYSLPGAGGYWDPEAGQFVRTQEKPSREDKVLDTIEKVSYTTNEMGQRVFDEQGYQKRIRNAIKQGRLPKEWGDIYGEGTSKMKYRVEGKGMIEIDPSEQEEFLKRYGKKAQMVQ